MIKCKHFKYQYISFYILLFYLFITTTKSNHESIHSSGKLVVKKENKPDITYSIVLPIKYNFFDILGASSSIRPVILVKENSLSNIPIEHIVSFMFAIYDKDQDGFLSYQELAIFQQHTNPKSPLTRDIFSIITHLLRVDNPYLGLTLHEFQSSYSQYKEELGTNATQDLLQIKKLWEITGPTWSKRISNI